MPLRAKAMNNGFTLLEMLIVMVIIAIVSVAGVNLINSQSPQRAVVNQAQQLSKQIKFLCEKSVFENRAFGLEFNRQAYQILALERGAWLAMDSDSATVPLAEHLKLDVILDGSKQIFDDEFQQKPHIVCLPNGQNSPFELQLESKEELEDKAVYLLTSDDNGELKGAWQ